MTRMHRSIPATLTLLFVALLFAGGFSACSKSDASVQLAAADTLVAQKKYDEAAKAYQAIIKDHPNSTQAPAAFYALGTLQLNEQNNPTVAIKTLEQLVSQHPESAWAHKAQFTIGFTYANQLQDFDKAKTAYNKYLAQYPDSSFAPHVRTELEHLGKTPEQLLEELQQTDTTTNVATK
jgi:outer membrane protein assembly factor BamD (BamD/ComL family)